jgi:hypothetical protein
LIYARDNPCGLDCGQWPAALPTVMKKQRRIGVLGTMGSAPYAGMAWMHGQFLRGLADLGHEVFYVETTTAWPYHPLQLTTTSDPTYTLGYLGRVMDYFGLKNCWAYRAAYLDRIWRGPLAETAEELIKSADAVLNITGSTSPEEVNVPCRLIYVGTDPVLQEVRIAAGDRELYERVANHDAHFTYGENIGQPDCPVPQLPFATTAMRQPVVMQLWQSPEPARQHFTTVTNWEVKGYDIEFQGETYTWSKHYELLKLIDLPKRTEAPLELALGLSGVSDQVRTLLTDNGWIIKDAYHMSLAPEKYRNYILTSGSEFSVAKDMVVRLRSGWFSERSACYLAAGRPVVTQDTAFSKVLPTGEGLFAFDTADEALSAIEAIRTNYAHHSRAAYEISAEYFAAEKVLTRMLTTLGL